MVGTRLTGESPCLPLVCRATGGKVGGILVSESGDWEIIQGDCLDVLREHAEGVFDAVVCDHKTAALTAAVASCRSSISQTSRSGIPNFLSAARFFVYCRTVRNWEAYTGPSGNRRGSACQYPPLTSSAEPSARKKSRQAQNRPVSGSRIKYCRRYVMPSRSSSIATISSRRDTDGTLPAAIALHWLAAARARAKGSLNCRIVAARIFSRAMAECPLPLVGFLSVTMWAPRERMVTPIFNRRRRTSSAETPSDRAISAMVSMPSTYRTAMSSGSAIRCESLLHCREQKVLVIPFFSTRWR